MIAQLDSDYIRTRPTKAISRLVSYVMFEGRPLTTKGQWLNPAVFAWLRLQRALPPMRRVDRPLFILGTGRSGTTVLGVVLSMHRDVGFLNEPKAMWHVIRPDEDVIGSYGSSTARYRLGAADATPQAVAAAHRIFGAYLMWTGARRVCDKYPELIFRVPFVRALFPDARFLFLVRNGWDTCASIAAWSDRLGVSQQSERHDWWGRDNRKWRLLLDEILAPDPVFADAMREIRAFSRQEDMAAAEWIATMREGRRLQQQIPDRVLEVRYEDLAATPRVALERIFRFAELDADATCLAYAERTLHPVPARKPFVLPDVIAPLFAQTMSEMGY